MVTLRYVLTPGFETEMHASRLTRFTPTTWTDPNGLWCVWDDGSHDDPPEDDGAGRMECIQQGGTWIDPVETTANVGSDGSSSVVTTGGGTGFGSSGGAGAGGALVNWDANRPSCIGQFVRNSASGIGNWLREKAQSFSPDAAGLLNPSDPELWGPQVGVGLAAVAQSVSASGMVGKAVLGGGVVTAGALNVTSGSLSALAAITSEATAWIDAGKVAAVAAGDTALAAYGASVAGLAGAGTAVGLAGYAAYSTYNAAKGGACTGNKLW